MGGKGRGSEKREEGGRKGERIKEMREKKGKEKENTGKKERRKRKEGRVKKKEKEKKGGGKIERLGKKKKSEVHLKYMRHNSNVTRYKECDAHETRASTTIIYLTQPKKHKLLA